MSNRIIKESAFTSDRIAQLSDFEFRLWVGLITQADDAGRGDARPAIIKGHVFALRDRVTIKDIDAAVHALAAAGCVSLYTVGGKPYYEFPSWAKHQRIRDCKPRFPGREDADLTSCGELPQSAASCGELPPKSESEYEYESNPNTNPTPAPAQKSDFERFWAVYPRRENKKDAEKAFDRAMKTHKGLTVDGLIAAIESQKKSIQWQDKQFIPHPATWLNGERWNNEVQTAPQKEGSSRNEKATQADIDDLKRIFGKVKGDTDA